MPRARHQFPASLNTSYPFLCPNTDGKWRFLAHRLFPSIIIATCFGNCLFSITITLIFYPKPKSESNAKILHTKSSPNWRAFNFGVLGIEPSQHEPESCVLPVYDTPKLGNNSKNRQKVNTLWHLPYFKYSFAFSTIFWIDESDFII